MNNFRAMMIFNKKKEDHKRQHLSFFFYSFDFHTWNKKNFKQLILKKRKQKENFKSYLNFPKEEENS